MAFDMITLAIAAFLFVVAGLVVLFVVFKLMKNIMKFFLTLLANSLVGLIFVFILSLVGVKIPLTLPYLASIALFGLGGLGTVLILMFMGVLKP
jgi:hypothetical protein